jgi:hypothetical protein
MTGRPMNRRACPGCSERYPFAMLRRRHAALAVHCLPSGDTIACEALPTVLALHGVPAAEPAAVPTPVALRSDAAA